MIQNKKLAEATIKSTEQRGQARRSTTKKVRFGVDTLAPAEYSISNRAINQALSELGLGHMINYPAVLGGAKELRVEPGNRSIIAT